MGRKINILIVDDNINLTKTMSLILERKGYSVATVKDGLETIEIIKNKSFNIILLDIKMPIINGVETFKRIKKIRHGQVVIMMTAYTVEDLVKEALDEGAYAIVYKPFDIEYLIDLIENVHVTKNSAFLMFGAFLILFSSM